jgi:hypothetical protein
MLRAAYDCCQDASARRGNPKLKEPNDGGEGRMVHFFISYNHADEAWAEWIAWQLEAAGYSTTVQAWDFGPGSNFVLEMQRATAEAERTIAVVSPDFLKSPYTAPEWAAAFAQDPSAQERKLIPVRVRPCQADGLLAPLVRIDLVGLDETAAAAALLSGIRLGRAKPSSPPAFPGNQADPEPPFPGPTNSDTERTSIASPDPNQTFSESEIVARIGGLRWGGLPDRRSGGWTGDVWLGTVLVPERQDQPYLDELRLGDTGLQHELLGLMIGTIFQPQLGTDIAEQRDSIAFVQRDDQSRREVATAEVYTDGTLVWRSAVPRRAGALSHSIADSHVIDEDAVRTMIARLLTFAQRFYHGRRMDPGSAHLGVSLNDIAFKHFGKLPTYPMSSFTIGNPRVEDPLRVPSIPLRISGDQLADAGTFAEMIVQHIAREFRLGDAYFSP